MAPRTRSQTFTVAKGTMKRFGAVIGGGTRVGSVQSCVDQTGLGDCAPLAVDLWSIDGGRLNGPDQGYYAAWFQNYLCDAFETQANFPLQLGFTEAQSDIAVATMAAARSNPSRPYVDLPVAALELGDVTQLLRDVGRSHLRNNKWGSPIRTPRPSFLGGDATTRAANSNLMYQFGIGPLVSDLVKLTNFKDQVDRRVGEINRLIENKGLRRTMKIANYSKTGITNRILQSQGWYVQEDLTWVSTQEVKAHCRWLPTPSFPADRSDDRMRNLAKRAVLGITLDASTMWEAMPWSWLIDWGSTFGTYFKSQRNIIPAVLSGVHIMRHTRTEYTHPGLDQPPTFPHWLSSTRVVVDKKQRAPSFVAPTAHFPFLNGRQVGILASLAVTRL